MRASPHQPPRRADPKWIWELNRLQHLPWLAQAWLFTGDERYAEALDQLDAWITEPARARHRLARRVRGGRAGDLGAVALQGLATTRR